MPYYRKYFNRQHMVRAKHTGGIPNPGFGIKVKAQHKGKSRNRRGRGTCHLEKEVTGDQKQWRIKVTTHGHEERLEEKLA